MPAPQVLPPPHVPAPDLRVLAAAVSICIASWVAPMLVVNFAFNTPLLEDASFPLGLLGLLVPLAGTIVAAVYGRAVSAVLAGTFLGAFLAVTIGSMDPFGTPRGSATIGLSGGPNGILLNFFVIYGLIVSAVGCWVAHAAHRDSGPRQWRSVFFPPRVPNRAGPGPCTECGASRARLPFSAPCRACGALQLDDRPCCACGGSMKALPLAKPCPKCGNVRMDESQRAQSRHGTP